MALHRVFVYGTLKRGEPNHYYMEDQCNGFAGFIAVGETVKQYPLIIGTEYNVPFLIHREGVGHNVMGEIYEVDDEMLKSLDRLENHPNLYCRLQEDVYISPGFAVNNDTSPILKCWIYFVVDLMTELDSYILYDYHSNGTHGRPYKTREQDVDASVLKRQLHGLE